MAVNPDLLLPADNIVARLGSMIFLWEVSSGGSGVYVLQIATDAAFANIVFQGETTLLQMEATFDPGYFYYWRVKRGAATSSTYRGFSAPPFSPEALLTHEADGQGRLLNQFRAET
jgi:hypothetical protein